MTRKRKIKRQRKRAGKRAGKRAKTVQVQLLTSLPRPNPADVQLRFVMHRKDEKDRIETVLQKNQYKRRRKKPPHRQKHEMQSPRTKEPVLVPVKPLVPSSSAAAEAEAVMEHGESLSIKEVMERVVDGRVEAVEPVVEQTPLRNWYLKSLERAQSVGVYQGQAVHESDADAVIMDVMSKNARLTGTRRSIPVIQEELNRAFAKVVCDHHEAQRMDGPPPQIAQQVTEMVTTWSPAQAFYYFENMTHLLSSSHDNMVAYSHLGGPQGNFTLDFARTMQLCLATDKLIHNTTHGSPKYLNAEPRMTQAMTRAQEIVNTGHLLPNPFEKTVPQHANVVNPAVSRLNMWNAALRRLGEQESFLIPRTYLAPQFPQQNGDDLMSDKLWSQLTYVPQQFLIDGQFYPYDYLLQHTSMGYEVDEFLQMHSGRASQQLGMIQQGVELVQLMGQHTTLMSVEGEHNHAASTLLMQFADMHTYKESTVSPMYLEDCVNSTLMEVQFMLKYGGAPAEPVLQQIERSLHLVPGDDAYWVVRLVLKAAFVTVMGMYVTSVVIALDPMAQLLVIVGTEWLASVSDWLSMHLAEAGVAVMGFGALQRQAFMRVLNRMNPLVHMNHLMDAMHGFQDAVVVSIHHAYDRIVQFCAQCLWSAGRSLMRVGGRVIPDLATVYGLRYSPEIVRTVGTAIDWGVGVVNTVQRYSAGTHDANIMRILEKANPATLGGLTQSLTADELRVLRSADAEKFVRNLRHEAALRNTGELIPVDVALAEYVWFLANNMSLQRQYNREKKALWELPQVPHTDFPYHGSLQYLRHAVGERWGDGFDQGLAALEHDPALPMYLNMLARVEGGDQLTLLRAFNHRRNVLHGRDSRHYQTFYADVLRRMYVGMAESRQAEGLPPMTRDAQMGIVYQFMVDRMTQFVDEHEQQLRRSTSELRLGPEDVESFFDVQFATPMTLTDHLFSYDTAMRLAVSLAAGGAITAGVSGVVGGAGVLLKTAAPVVTAGVTHLVNGFLGLGPGRSATAGYPLPSSGLTDRWVSDVFAPQLHQRYLEYGLEGKYEPLSQASHVFDADLYSYRDPSQTGVVPFSAELPILTRLQLRMRDNIRMRVEEEIYVRDRQVVFAHVVHRQFEEQGLSDVPDVDELLQTLRRERVDPSGSRADYNALMAGLTGTRDAFVRGALTAFAGQVVTEVTHNLNQRGPETFVKVHPSLNLFGFPEPPQEGDGWMGFLTRPFRHTRGVGLGALAADVGDSRTMAGHVQANGSLQWVTVALGSLSALCFAGLALGMRQRGGGNRLATVGLVLSLFVDSAVNLPDGGAQIMHPLVSMDEQHVLSLGMELGEAIANQSMRQVTPPPEHRPLQTPELSTS